MTNDETEITYMLQLFFYLDFFSLCFKFVSIHYHTHKQKKNINKSTAIYNIYIYKRCASVEIKEIHISIITGY